MVSDTDILQIDIAGLSIPLHDVRANLAELRVVYDLFDRRGDAFKADDRNPHLCRAGCSHCCKSGAVFAVTLAEAVQWSLAVEGMPEPARRRAIRDVGALLLQQDRVFETVEGPADDPGERDEALFSARVTRLNASGPACPMLVDDLCTIYDDRPMLCRAYGFPVDAYSVEAPGSIVFRSLCILYEGMELTDHVRAKDLKARLAEISCRMGGGRDRGRFTSLEAIVSRVERVRAGARTARPAGPIGGKTFD